MSLSVKNMLGGGKPEGLYVWKKSEIGSELKEINESVSTLPYSFYNGCAVVLNGEIHILGGADSTTKHYKWDGTNWTSVSTLPYNFASGSAVVLNDEIHIFGSSYSSSYYKYHYKWNGSSWISVSTLPYDFYNGAAVVLNGEIHILGSESNNNPTRHYKWNGSRWTSVSTLPYNFYQGSAVVFDNAIHILGGVDNGAKHYKFDGTLWTSVSTLPYNYSSGSAVVFDNAIHILGSSDTAYKKYHYKWNGSSWTKVGTLPYSLSYGSAVVYNNGIHILGSNESSNYTKHYLIIGYAPTYTFLDYIVSDKETAYPDGGEKNGYWYEKVVGGIDLKSIFNLTDIAVDTFTPTSDLDSPNIPHSLGKVPKVALIVARYGDITLNYRNQIALYGSITEFSMGSGTRLSYMNSFDYLGSYTNSADWDSSKIIPRSSSSNSIFASGVKYTLITMA